MLSVHRIIGYDEGVLDGRHTAFGVAAELGFYRGRAEARISVHSDGTR